MGRKLNGTVVRLVADKGFGFIQVEGDSVERFFHRSACQGVDFSQLSKGDLVTFEDGNGPKGPRAEQVELTE